MKRSTDGIVHRGLRYELVPASMLISAGFVLSSAEISKVAFFTSDKAYERADISQGDVGKRWKSTV